MRLGFVGVGKWAGKLATAFRACGAEIVAFDRSKRPPTFCEPHSATYERDARESGAVIDGFGSYMPWRDQLADKSIDAIIAVAPPEITTCVALAAAESGRPILATKPLNAHPIKTTAPFWIDYWRLWAPAHAHPRELRYDLYGVGPFRAFLGGLDYGPHVMAAMLDKGDVRLLSAKSVAPGDGELFDCEFSVDGELVRSAFGNGAVSGVRNIWGWEETPTEIGGHDKSSILESFCRAFMNSVADGHDDGRLLRLSRDGSSLLGQVRNQAT